MLYCLMEKFVYCLFTIRLKQIRKASQSFVHLFTRSLNPFYALDKPFKRNLYLFNVLEKMFKQLAYLFLHDVLDYTLQYLSPSSHHTEQLGLKFPILQEVFNGKTFCYCFIYCLLFLCTMLGWRGSSTICAM